MNHQLQNAVRFAERYCTRENMYCKNLFGNKKVISNDKATR